MRLVHFFALSISTASLSLASCTPVPDLGPKPLPRAPSDVVANRSLSHVLKADWPDEGWWRGYGDEQLDQLIDEGLRNSPDLVVAAARFRRAAAMQQQAGGALVPRIDAEASTGLSKQSYNNGPSTVPRGWLGTGRTALTFDLDLDLWGRNRAALAAATSEAYAAEIDMAQARLVLTTGITEAYADLARLHANHDIAERSLALRTASQSLVANRQANGLETRGSLRQSDAAVASARVEVTATEEAIALRRNQIAALIGAGPDRALTINRPQPQAWVQPGLPSDVTTDLIGRRPDISAARARVEAAASRIKVARADFLPAIRLSALAGFQSLGYTPAAPGTGATGSASPFIDTLFKSGSLFGSIGPAISLPIFRGGELQGQYRGARATYDEAVGNYDRTILTAYREVVDAVTSRDALVRSRVDARGALAASQDAYDIARKRYEGGLSSYLDVLTVEDRLLAAQQVAADLDARGFALDVALIRALGGSFVAAPAPTSKDNDHG
ncbi:MAG: efflux transporter outer membrane subunit [Sphingopyxis sp.]|nr:efflux transporter outer membrane subunit [Sphingopyxis sp.]